MSSPAARQVLRLAGVVTLLALGGCGLFRGSSCLKPGPYAKAQEVAPLKIPEELDGPDTRGALRIPPLTEPEAPRAASDNTCLDQPPKISAPAPAAPATTPAR